MKFTSKDNCILAMSSMMPNFPILDKKKMLKLASPRIKKMVKYLMYGETKGLTHEELRIANMWKNPATVK